MNREDLVYKLNDKSKKVRLKSLKKLKKLEQEDATLIPTKNELAVNNHIHTSFSFSPYSPTKAVYMAYLSGLTTMGIVDHDTLSGADEFVDACKILGTDATIGLEVRTHFEKEEFKSRKINNRYQNGLGYMTVYGIPETSIKPFNKLLSSLRKSRFERNALMIERLNKKLKKYDLSINYDKDVVKNSFYKKGGTITERHILYALSKKLIEKFGKGEKLVEFISSSFKIELDENNKRLLLDESNPFYEYDVMTAIKSAVKNFYIEAKTECLEVKELISIAKSYGGIVSYLYLGDRIDDKGNTIKLEDEYLPELIVYLKELGVHSISYIPSTLTSEQLTRIKSLCKENELLELSSESINSPRQSFENASTETSEHDDLILSTWALIGHQISVTSNVEDGMFTAKTIEKVPSLKERIKLFARIGKND